MRYATYSMLKGGPARLAVLRSGRLEDLEALVSARWGKPFPSGMLEFIDAGPDAWRKMAALVEQAPAGPALRANEIHLHSPIPRPRKNVVCLGLNYVAHMEESAKARGRDVKIPEVPVFFTKAPTAVAGPFDDISWDQSVTGQVDYEAELGVVIGTGGKNISRAQALDHVFGYTIINDFSARDLQMRHYQWFKGKSLDGFCPMGPHIVTPDEFGDPQRKRVSLRVNGVSKQDGNTAQQIFPVDVTIEYLSQGTTLEPGDIISTGTPEGVGLGRTPPEYLREGDVVETEVEGIGVMRNRIVVTGKVARGAGA